MTATQEAIGILDRAIDRIEKYGFNITRYGDECGYDPSGCYIGTVRLAAELSATPPDSNGARNGASIYTTYGRNVHKGVQAALAVLDHIALPLITSENCLRRVERYGFKASGRIVESYGFQVHQYSYNSKDETRVALGLLRQAKSVLEEFVDADRTEAVETPAKELDPVHS